jgi:hypothetical protein
LLGRPSAKHASSQDAPTNPPVRTALARAFVRTSMDKNELAISDRIRCNGARAPRQIGKSIGPI